MGLPGDGRELMFRVGSCPARARTALRARLPVAVVNPPDTKWASQLRQLEADSPMLEWVPSAQAELIWDGATGEVRSQHGDVVARIAAPAADSAADSAADPVAEFRGIVDKWRTLPALRALGECRQPLLLSILEGDGLHRAAQRVTLSVAPRQEPYLTLINLPANGEIQYLFPLDRFGDNPRTDPKQPYEMNFVVQAPFGGDHLIALASREQPVVLQQQLARPNGQRAAPELFALLHTLLEPVAGQHELGILSFYTAP